MNKRALALRGYRKETTKCMKEAEKKKERKKGGKKRKEEGRKKGKAVERKNKMRGRRDIQMGVLVIATRIRYFGNLAVPFPSPLSLSLGFS